MNKFKKSMSIILAFIMSFSVFVLPVSAEEKIVLNILGTSDLHGKIYPWEYATDSAQEWGLAKIATLIKEERVKDPDLLLVDNGDTIESNMIDLFNSEEVHPMIKVLNEMKYDTWTLGNHEFNFGLDVLGRAIKNFNGTTLSANTTKKDGETFVAPYVVKEVKGVKIGLLGMTAPHIKRWEASNPDHFKNLDFNDPLATAKKYVDILKNEEKVDIIIGLFHLGESGNEYDPNMVDAAGEIAEKVPGIDAIFAGHAHATLGQKDKQLLVNDTIILEPGSDGKFVAKLTIEVVKDGNTFKVVNKNTDLLSVKDIEADAKVLEISKYVDEKSKEEANKVVGKATGDFVGTVAVKGIPEAQIRDTAVVDLINEVQLFYSKADVSAAAMFDTRSNLKEGDLKFKDVALIYKYSNTLQAHKINGKQLKEYMEWSAKYYNTQVDGDVTVSFDSSVRAYNYDMFANIDYKIDITKPVGERIINPTINTEPIGDNKEYTLAINDHRVGTLQSLDILPEDGSSLVYDSMDTTTPEMQRLIQSYIADELGGVVVPKTDNNWSLITKDSKDLLGAKEAITLINLENIELPVSEDGRTPNVKSINVLEKATPEHIKAVSESAKVNVTTTDLTNGELYKEVVEKLNISIEVKPEVKPEVTPEVTPEVKPEVTPNEKEQVYVVKQGDSLWKIGKQFNMDWSKIVEYNKISNPRLIHPGQEILIPAA